MSGLEKRLKRLFRKARRQPSDKAIHLISFSITLLGVVLVLVLALTLLIPELVQSFHSLYLQIEANIPPLDRLSECAECRHGLADELAGRHQLGAAAAQDHCRHRYCADQCGKRRICHGECCGDSLLCLDHLHLYVPWLGKSLPTRPHAGVRLSEAEPRRRAAEVLQSVPPVFRKLSYRTVQRSGDPRRPHDPCVFRFPDPLRQSCGNADRHLRHHPLRRRADLLRGQRVPCALVDPVLAVRCLIVYLAVQFIENQFIYPRVVGKSVGLSPLTPLLPP